MQELGKTWNFENKCPQIISLSFAERRLDIFLQSRLHLKKRDYSSVIPWVLNKLTQEADLAYHCSDLKENLAVKMANKILDCLRNETVNSTKKVEMPLAV